MRLGRKHPSTLSGRTNLVLASQGRWLEAVWECKMILQARDAQLGREHISTLASVANLLDIGTSAPVIFSRRLATLTARDVPSRLGVLACKSFCAPRDGLPAPSGLQADAFLGLGASVRIRSLCLEMSAFHAETLQTSRPSPLPLCCPYPSRRAASCRTARTVGMRRRTALKAQQRLERKALYACVSGCSLSRSVSVIMGARGRRSPTPCPAVILLHPFGTWMACSLSRAIVRGCRSSCGRRSCWSKRPCRRG